MSLPKQLPGPQSKVRKYVPVVVFVVLITVVAGAYRLFSSSAVEGHHAQCISISASKSIVKPNQTFTGQVKMKNDGTTTYSPSVGMYLGDPDNKWSFSGNGLSSNVPPGSSVTFNLTLHAPSTPGKYNYRAAMAIATKGFIYKYCTAPRITVAGTPSVSITSPTNGSRVKGDVTFAANASNNIPISKVEFYVNGSKIGADQTADYAIKWNSKNYHDGNYALNARVVDSLGQAKYSSTVTVAVDNIPPTSTKPPSGGGGGGGGGSSGGGGGGGGSSQSSGSSAGTPDTKAPSSPSEFKAVAEEDTKSINLSWGTSQDNVGVTSYELQRSDDDKKTWATLDDSISADTLSYNDASVGFDKTVYYQLRAFDAAGNSSDYASAQVDTSEFQANTNGDNDTTVTSEDQLVTVTIPAGAIDQDAFCTITVSSDVLPPNVKNLVTVTGPYQLVCRKSDGNLINEFNQPFVLIAHVNPKDHKGVKGLLYYGQNDDTDWQKLNLTSHDKKSSTDTVDLQNNQIFVVMGTKKTTPLIIKIFLILLFIGLIIVIFRFINRFLLKRKAISDYDEYLRKAKGL